MPVRTPEEWAGSLDLRFNYLPADLASTTIQVREPRAKAEDDAPEANAGE